MSFLSQLATGRDKGEGGAHLSSRQRRLGAPFKPYFGLSGIPQHSMGLFCHPACSGMPWEQPACVWQLINDTAKIAIDARPGGPAAQTQPSPEGLGINRDENLSAIGAALNLDPPAPVSLEGDDSASPATKAGCPIQAVLWLEWDSTALDGLFCHLACPRMPWEQPACVWQLINDTPKSRWMRGPEGRPPNFSPARKGWVSIAEMI
jgi:hypothetical protein